MLNESAGTNIRHTGCCDAHVAGMISSRDVRTELLALAQRIPRDIQVSLNASNGRVLSRDIYARLDLPPSNNSAMDGYALGPRCGAGKYRVVARTAAGEETPNSPLAAGEAVRIFTGAPVPSGTFSVAKQEDVSRCGDQVSLSEMPVAGQNIRLAGEDMKTGELVVRAGTVLDARHRAILASMGVVKIPVTAPVRVAVFSSGKELQEPGTDLKLAKIYDSNRWMLMALLDSPMFDIMDLGILPDNRAAIANVLGRAGEVSDLILSTGGVSVGEEDHMFAALSDVGTEIKQHRVAVKPGKPVVFGKIGKAISLCLPGNPVAALVSFQLLARPLISVLAGAPVRELAPAAAISDFEWHRNPGRTEYFPARMVGADDDGRALLVRLGPGGSALLNPLVQADGLARVAQDTEKVSHGSSLDWFPFSGGFQL